MHRMGTMHHAEHFGAGPVLRRLLILCLVLVLAVVANVGVAWSCVEASSLTRSFVDATPDERRLWEESTAELLRGSGWVVRVFAESHDGPGVCQRLSFAEVGDFPDTDLWLFWGEKRTIRAGWPFHCLEGSAIEENGGELIRDGTVCSPWSWTESRAHPGGWRDLPYHPMWLGFAANTLFYSVAAWLVIAIRLTIRWRFRRLRHRCPTCGYPVGVSEVCTECGRGVAL